MISSENMSRLAYAQKLLGDVREELATQIEYEKEVGYFDVSHIQEAYDLVCVTCDALDEYLG